MHQIDENKDSAIYNAYMGVEERSYKQPANHTHQPSYYSHSQMHRPPPSYHHQPQPQHQHPHQPQNQHQYQYHHYRQSPPRPNKQRPYVSRRPHSDNTQTLIPVPQQSNLSRTQSSPQRYHQKTRHRTPYNSHYNTPQKTPTQPPHNPHNPHNPSYYYPPPSQPPGSSYRHHQNQNQAAQSPPHPSYNPPSKSYKTPPKTTNTTPYDYFQASPKVTYVYKSPKSPKSPSPVMHIPSKVPSLLSKTKPPKKTKTTEIIDIGMTKLDTPIEELAIAQIDKEKVEVKISEKLPDSPNIKFALQRQYSEPDAKAMRDIERDLNALPLTPPFNATDDDILGLPTNLIYAKTTPLNYDESHTSVYSHVNQAYYPHYIIPPSQPPPQRLPLQSPYNLNAHVHAYNPYVNNPQSQSQSRKKQKKKKKNKRQSTAQQMENDIYAQQQLEYETHLLALSSGFDFAVFDLNQQLKLIKKELSELEKQITATESKTKITQITLKQTNQEREKILNTSAMEKLAIQKSLQQDMDDEGQMDEVKMREFWCTQSASLTRQCARLRTKNMAASASADVMHKHLRIQLENARESLNMAKKERDINKNKNMRFELEVIELTEIVNNLKENVDSQRHGNFLAASKCNKEIVDDDDNSAQQQEYPPEIVIQQNLIRAQVEFYFSDYNLKRDKRLLEKICKEPRRGYLAVEEVLSLSRVRQLCNTSGHLYESLKVSPYINMILPEEEIELQLQQQQQAQLQVQVPVQVVKKTVEGEKEEKKEKEEPQFHPLFVGRKHFTPPVEKQFPFRRSVYIYGLPWYSDEKYIYSMLNAFGGVTKVHFDHGPDTLDRQIMKKMLEKHRVYKLLSKDSAAMTMEFNFMHNKQEQYNCYWCHKQKPCSDGYYHPKRIPGTPPTYRVCLQCAAAKAEEQCSKYDARSKLLKDDKRLRELLLGLPPRPVVQCKTALCVFASQRQASKCVYVRSRLAYDGAFATHYHHYSKLKKEIALSIKPKIRILSDVVSKKPNMLKTYTAPVYQQEGTAVIQPHLKK